MPPQPASPSINPPSATQAASAAGTAAAAAGSYPFASPSSASGQISIAQASGSTQQPMAKQQSTAPYSMSKAGGEAAGSYSISGGHHSNAPGLPEGAGCGQGATPFSGGAGPAEAPNGLSPASSSKMTHSGLAAHARAHGSSNGNPVGHSLPAVTQATRQQQPQATQGEAAGKSAAAGPQDGDAAETRLESQQEVLNQVMPGKAQTPDAGAASEMSKAAGIHSNGQVASAAQPGAARSDATDLNHLPDAPELIEPRLLAGMPQILLAD